MHLWIKHNRYFVVLPNGESFGIDRHGNSYTWVPEPGTHVGRAIRLADLPTHIRAAVERRVALAERAVAAAA